MGYLANWRGADTERVVHARHYTGSPDVLLLVLVFSPISHVTAHHFEEGSDKQMGIRGYPQRAMVNSKTSQTKKHFSMPNISSFRHPMSFCHLGMPMENADIENADWKALLKACNRLPSHKAVPGVPSQAEADQENTSSLLQGEPMTTRQTTIA